MIGAGTITLSVLTGGSLFYLTSKASLLLSRRSKNYNEVGSVLDSVWMVILNLDNSLR